MTLRTCDSARNRTGPDRDGLQVGATLASGIRVGSGTARWDVGGNVYATCPQTNQGTFAQCVRVLVESSQPAPRDDDDDDDHLAAKNGTIVTYVRALSNRVMLDCVVPKYGDDDDAAAPLENSLDWILPVGAVFFLAAGYVVATARRKRRPDDDAPSIWSCWKRARAAAEPDPARREIRTLVRSGLATSTDDWILDFERLELGELVGVGATASVFRGAYAAGVRSLSISTRRSPFGLILAALECWRRPRSNAEEASANARDTQVRRPHQFSLSAFHASAQRLDGARLGRLHPRHQAVADVVQRVRPAERDEPRQRAPGAADPVPAAAPKSSVSERSCFGRRRLR